MRPLLSLLLLTLALCVTSISAHPGIGIAMDSEGNVFFTDLVHVWKIDQSGDLSIAVRDVHTHELYVDKDDNLYGEHVWYQGEATDTWAHYLWCLDTAGTFQNLTGEVQGVPENNRLQRDGSGSSYYAAKAEDHESLMVEDPKGQSQAYTQHAFEDIRWIRAHPDNGLVYLVDMLSVKTVDSTGQVRTLIADLKSSTEAFAGVGDRHYAYGMWTEPSGRLYVAVFGSQKVISIQPDGLIETVVEMDGEWSPSGGLIGPDGSLWLLEYSLMNEARVRRIRPDGKVAIFEH